MLPTTGIPSEGQEKTPVAPVKEGKPVNLDQTNRGSISLSPTSLEGTNLLFLPSRPAEEITPIREYIVADADPADGGVEDAQAASAPMAEEVVADAAVPLPQETAVTEVCEAIGGDSSTFTVPQASKATEAAAAPTAGESSEEASWTPVQTTEETNDSLSFLVPNAGREPIPPAFSFLTFYGLREQPFEVTPDPAYLYLSPVHREALISLSQGVQNLRGFMALVAGPGMGKTTLLNRLMEELRDTARTVFLFQTQCNSREMLRYLLCELGVECAAMDVVAMHQALNAVLFEEMLKGRRFVLIVDEAQNLDASTLETIRLLSDFETTHSKLIQIILAGQPQLVETLLRPDLSQLRQRIAILANLEPLRSCETSQYIEHRLHTAGLRGGAIFTPDAVAMIAERSQGIPRNINNLCFNSLQAGYSEGLDIIDANIIQGVAARLDLQALLDCGPQDPAPAKDVPKASMSPSSQLARVLLDALANEHQAAQRLLQERHPNTATVVTGRLTEKFISRGWGKESEFRIEVSLERQGSFEIPVADRYYCCSIYVSEEQGKLLRAGQPVRIRIEQD